MGWPDAIAAVAMAVAVVAACATFFGLAWLGVRNEPPDTLAIGNPVERNDGDLTKNPKSK